MANPNVEEFLETVLTIASGEMRARNEVNHCQEIAIFKDGITL